MTRDRCGQFTSHLWAELCNFLGCKLVHTTAFHPESNGFLERQHRTLKAALKAEENPRDWFFNLELVLLGIRSTPKSDFEVSSAQLCLGTSLPLPGQFFEPSSETPQTEYCAQLCQFMSTFRAPLPHHHGTPRSYVEKALQTCTHVFVKNDTARSSFDRSYKDPYRVLNKEDKNFSYLVCLLAKMLFPLTDFELLIFSHPTMSPKHSSPLKDVLNHFQYRHPCQKLFPTL